MDSDQFTAHEKGIIFVRLVWGTLLGVVRFCRLVGYCYAFQWSLVSCRRFFSARPCVPLEEMRALFPRVPDQRGTAMLFGPATCGQLGDLYERLGNPPPEPGFRNEDPLLRELQAAIIRRVFREGLGLVVPWAEADKLSINGSLHDLVWKFLSHCQRNGVELRADNLNRELPAFANKIEDEMLLDKSPLEAFRERLRVELFRLRELPTWMANGLAWMISLAFWIGNPSWGKTARDPRARPSGSVVIDRLHDLYREQDKEQHLHGTYLKVLVAANTKMRLLQIMSNIDNPLIVDACLASIVKNAGSDDGYHFPGDSRWKKKTDP